VIKINRDFMDKLKDKLLEKETVDADEVKELLTGARMPKDAALY
jgi:ATP-dependent Zn protease